ncbi:acyl-CoA N-acyltransferase, partial [Lojkania enalia]
DVPKILQFIQDAASETGAHQHVHATAASLLSTLHLAPFSPPSQNEPPKPAKALLLISPSDPGDVLGMAIFYPTYSTWISAPGICLEELYVRPEERRKGYARLLISKLAREVQRTGGARLEWVCLEGNRGALGFYEGLGARRKEGWVQLKVEGEAVDRLACGGEVGEGYVEG